MNSLGDLIITPTLAAPMLKLMHIINFMSFTPQPIEYLVDDILYYESPPDDLA